MKTITVNASSKYDIIIDKGALSRSGDYIKSVSNAKKAMIITDTNVAPLYLDTVKKSLISAGLETYRHIFPAGEKSKNLRTIESIYYSLSTNHFTRGDIIVALGGGVCGDMSGFAAATYMRGIDYVQIPTSLLAQVDSSVGGKTGVDTDFGKNLVGAFYQPKIVIIDPNTLSTLDNRFFADGMGEVIKYGCIKSTSLFDKLQKSDAKDIIEDVIEECVTIKRDIVSEDEHEQGIRMILNFGHTIGHAIEKLHNYDTITHGQAVSIGMVMMTQAAERHSLAAIGTSKKIISLCQKYCLPVSDNADLQLVAECALNDKKSRHNEINIIIVDKIGHCFVKTIEHNDFYKFLSIK